VTPVISLVRRDILVRSTGGCISCHGIHRFNCSL
jgi:hypothetical protein